MSKFRLFALFLFLALGTTVLFGTSAFAYITSDQQSGDNCSGGSQSFLSGYGLNCHRKNTYPGSHTNASYITESTVKSCCGPKSNSMWNRCASPNYMHYGVIVEDTSSYSIQRTGTTNLSVLGYHFACGNDEPWYATSISITSNCNGAVSLNQSYLSEGTGGRGRFGWINGSSTNLFRVDNSKIAAATSGTSYTCNITIKVCGGNSSSYCNGEYHSHDLTFKFSMPAACTCSCCSCSPCSKTFTLAYDANGGSGAPSNWSTTDNNVTTSNPTKTTTVSTTKPSRSNYAFTGWKTSGGTSYSGGNSITIGPGTTTLYAQWVQYTKTINYYGQGGKNSSNQENWTDSNTNGNTTYATTIANISRSGYDLVGWNTKSDGSGTFYQPGNSVTVNTNGLILYAIWAQTATFTGSIDVSSTNLTGDATNGFRGNGYDTKYNLTAYYKIARSNSTPTAANSRYAISASGTYPTSPTSTATSLTTSSPLTVPQTVEVTVASGESGGSARQCFSLSFDNSVGYVNGSLFTSPLDTRKFNGRAQKCVSIVNPKKWGATFSGSISIANGNALTGSSTARTGNGLHSQYSITPTYTLKRTNNSPARAVSSRYAFATHSGDHNNSYYPSSPTNTSDELSHNASKAYDGGATIVNVDIDGSATQCFYLSYDNMVYYIGEYNNASPNKRVFNGHSDQTCVTITNPSQTYTATFSGSTNGSLDAHDKLIRTNNDRDGEIDTQRRIADGSFVEEYPASDKYTATFNHTITRTNSDESSTASTKYYINSARVDWQVQYCVDAECNAGTYKNYPASADNNTSLATSGTMHLTAGASQTITTTPKWILNASNKGTYVRQCQRVAYNEQTNYKTVTNTSNRSSYKDSITGLNNTKYTTPICVNLKNPYWSNNIVGASPVHYIDVDGTTSLQNVSGAKQVSGNNYEATGVNSTFTFDHTVARHDNRSGSFDESDLPSLFDRCKTEQCFYQSSLYNNSNYAVGSTNSNSQLKMWGREKINTNPFELVYPFRNNSPVNGLPISLNAKNKNEGGVYSSNDQSGRTKTTLYGNSLVAGASHTFTHGIYISRVAWSVTYNHIYRREAYTGWNASATKQTYDRTKRISDSPQLTTPEYYDNAGESYTVTRPYNFKITSIQPTNVPSPDGEVVEPGETFTIDYSVRVSRENTEHDYITDPNWTDDSRYVYVIGYIMEKDVSVESANSVITEGTANDPCSRFYAVARSGSCTIESGHANKVKLLGDEAKEGNPDPSAGTPFRNVYAATTDNTYGYSTSTLTVPSGLRVGEKYCVAIAARSWSSDMSGLASYRISSSICYNVSKRPSLQVWGGSIISGGGIAASTINYNSQLFGSWADYAVIAKGEIRNMSSGAATISGVPNNSALCDRSRLTIANQSVCAGTEDAKLGESEVDPRAYIIEKLIGYLQPNTNNLSNLPPNPISGTYIIHSESDLTITRNIELTSPYSQVVVFAPSINIAEDVTRVDALLVATNVINTCTTSSGGDIALSNATCTNPLRINGALIANQVLFRRTYGADSTEGTVKEPAEIVNYSASLLLWGFDRASGQRNPQIVYRKKLPTRY